MRLVGLGPWPGNPKYCRGCFRDLYRKRMGAEIPCSLLFADVRDSTRLAETMTPSAFRQILDRFYETAFDVLVDHDAFVDKFVGDEVIGIFVPAMSDGPHARDAIVAGLDLLERTGHRTPRPWIPIGIGVNSGIAYVGAVGTEEHVEFTALGDIVNVTARLAGQAGRGEVLAMLQALEMAELPVAARERRRLELKGKSELTDVVVLTVDDVESVRRPPAPARGR